MAGLADDALTQAVAILYAAQVRRSNAEEEFRFSLAIEGQGVVSALYNAMQAGSVPAPPGADALAKVTFAIDFPDSLGKRLFGRLGRPGRGPQHELDLGVLPLVLDGAGSVAPPRGTWGAAVEVDLLVLVADASGRSGPDPSLDSGFDRLVSGFAKGVPECVLFWLLDAPGNPDIRPPAAGPPRLDLAADTLKARLPRTAARLAAAKQTPPCAFAWLAPDLSAGPGAIRRRRLKEGHTIEPEYPYDEMTALMDALAARSR